MSSGSLYLLADIGSTFTKVALVDTAEPRLIATAQSPTTIDVDINDGFDAACGGLGVDVSGVGHTLCCSSAAGGLAIAAVGLVPDLTAKAARMAALGAGGKVIETFSYRLNSVDIAAIMKAAPDIILLAGGTDGGNKKYIIENAQKLQEACPQTALIVAGNRDACDELQEVFAGRTDVFFADNVMPEFGKLELEPARATIRKVFLDRIVHSKGLDRLRSRARVVMPTPESVLKAAMLFARGVDGDGGIGEILLIDMGGATTDVYSCASGEPKSPGAVYRGLPEPDDKRTVEADIGLSHSLPYLLEQLNQLEQVDRGDASADEVAKWKATVGADLSHCPSDEGERRAATATARAGCKLAVKRHVGRLEETYTPEGRMFIQEGKDLADVKWIIGSGGAISRSIEAETILSAALREENSLTLEPIQPSFLVDSKYIMWAMGLIADEEPRAALTIMKEHVASSRSDPVARAG